MNIINDKSATSVRKPCMCMITCPDEQTAELISEGLVTNSLAACVNSLTGIKSVYLWDGKLCHDTEVLLIVKTVLENLDSIEKYIHSVHPYDLPEIIFFEIDAGSSSYLNWLLKSSDFKGVITSGEEE